MVWPVVQGPKICIITGPRILCLLTGDIIFWGYIGQNVFRLMALWTLPPRQSGPRMPETYGVLRSGDLIISGPRTSTYHPGIQSKGWQWLNIPLVLIKRKPWPMLEWNLCCVIRRRFQVIFDPWKVRKHPSHRRLLLCHKQNREKVMCMTIDILMLGTSQLVTV